MLCDPCDYTCQTCTNSSMCLACNSVKMRLFDSLSIKCECLDRYYDDLVN